MGLVAKVNASLKQLAHRVIGKRHRYSPVVPPRIRKPGPQPEVTGRPPDGFKAMIRV
jgi:hypothetical protein